MNQFLVMLIKVNIKTNLQQTLCNTKFISGMFVYLVKLADSINNPKGINYWPLVLASVVSKIYEKGYCL